MTLWDLEEIVEKLYVKDGAKSDTPIMGNLDGYPFEVSKIELDDDGVIRIHFKV